MKITLIFIRPSTGTVVRIEAYVLNERMGERLGEEILNREFIGWTVGYLCA